MTVAPTPDPTPEEYDERIAEIQATWSPEERVRRAVVKVKPWTIPLVDAPEGIGQATPPDHHGVPT